MKKCLIADNNQFYLEFFADLMIEYGYDVKKASDGLEALELARNDEYDLFIFDYVMPKIDGFRLAKYVKSIDKYKNTPIILITAAALESISWDENELYADVIVAKGPLKKMKDVFSQIMPNLIELTFNKENKIYGLDDIYPRQIVKELLKVEVHHSAIFENLIEGVAELDESGHIIFANRSFLELFGKNEEKIIGFPIDKILDFDKFPDLRDAYKKVYSVSSNIRENVIISFDNKTIHLSLYNIINNNVCTGVFIIAQDVTSVRKKVYEIGTLFNITQAFLSNLPYNRVLEYVIYEMRRLVRAINVTLLLSCEGFFKGAVISAVDRRLERNDKSKIEFWINKIKEWKEEGLLTLEVATKVNKVKFENIPILWFPLIFQGKYFGTLLGFKNYNDDFDEESLKFFEAVGNQIAVYLANIEFFNKLSNFKNKEQEIKKEIESVVKKEYDDCIKQNYYDRWNSRNKRTIISNLLEEMSNSLSTLRGYGSILTAVKEEDRANIKDLTNIFYNPLHKILCIKEDIAMMNKIGVDEDMNLHLFFICDLAKKVVEILNDDRVVLGNCQSLTKKLADFERLVFLLKMLIKALLNKGVRCVKINAEDYVDYSELSLLLETGDNVFSSNLGQELEELSKDEWNEIDSDVYYFGWHIKMFVKMLNGRFLLESKYPAIIKFQFS